MSISKKLILYKLLVIVIVILGAIVGGCAGKHCFSAGGDYKGIAGDVEYCFDNAAAKDAGVPAITDSKTQTTYFGLTEEQLKSINEKLKSLMGSASAKDTSINQVKILFGLIGEKK